MIKSHTRVAETKRKFHKLHQIPCIDDQWLTGKPQTIAGAIGDCSVADPGDGIDVET